MVLSEMMNEKIVDLSMEAKSKEEAINIMAKMLYDNNRISSIDEFVTDVFKREEMETTNMDVGVAIPHSQSPVIQKTSVALIRLNEEISWDDFGEPIKIVFMLAVSPKDEGVEHLELISKIAELLIDDHYIALLNKTTNKRKLLRKMNKLLGG